MRKLLRILFLISLVLLVMQQLFAWHYNQSFPKEEIDALFKPIVSKYGIKVVYEIGEDFFSQLENPPIPAGPHRDSEVKPIRHRVLMKYPAILHKALEKYPDDVIRNYLNGLHFARTIDQAGFIFSGSYDPFRRIVYLVDNGEKSDDQAMSTFHHEFSSLLINRHSFWIDPWTAHNPKNHKYLYDDRTDDVLQMYNSTSLVGTEDDYEKGFMNSYGQTCFGNDFSEYSAMILTHPEKFKNVMDQYTRVRGKFLVWLDFYQKVDPIFTEAYLFGSQKAPSAKEHAMADEKS